MRLRPLAGWWPWAATCLLLLLAFPDPPGFFSHNERPRLLAGRALADHGRLDLEAPGVRDHDPGIDVARAPSGRLYPNKAPGAVFPAALAWHLARRAHDPPAVQRLLARLLGAALPLVLLFSWAYFDPQVPPRRRPVHRGAAVLLVLATPLWPYGKVLYGHTLAAAFLYAAHRLLGPGGPGPARRGAAAGFCAGIALAVEYQAAFFLLPAVVTVLAGLRGAQGRRRAAGAAVGLALPVAALAAYHTHAFGGPFSTGYHHAVDPGFARIHARGLLGLSWPTARGLYEHFLSPWGGVLPVAPLILLSLLAPLSPSSGGAAPLPPRTARAAVGVALAVLAGLSQSGGFRVGPRYVVSVLPLCLPGLAAYGTRARRERSYAFLLGLAAMVGLATCGLAATVFPHLPPWGDPLADVLVPLARSTVPVPTLVGPLPARFLVVGTLGLAAATAASALVRCLSPTTRRAAAVGALVGAMLLAVRAQAPTEAGSAFCRALARAARAAVPCP